MLVHIGEDVIYEKKHYHVQDIDFLNGMALIGQVDTNGICFDLKWVKFSDIARVTPILKG